MLWVRVHSFKETTMYKIALTLGLVILMLAVNVSAFTYEITYYDDSVAGNTIDTDPVSFFSANADNILLAQNLFFIFNVSSPPDTYSGAYLSPFGVTFGVSSGSLSNNVSCLNIGTATKSFTATNAEGRNTMTHDGNAISTIQTGNQFIVTTDERYFTITNELLDSENYVPNLYFRNRCLLDDSAISSQNITINFNSDNYGECVALVTARTLLTYASCETNIPKYYGYTIFNSTAGNVTFKSRTPDNNGQTRHILYALDDPSIIIESCVNTISCIKNVNLEPNTLYVVGVGAGVITSGDDETPLINITIDLGIPDYDCPSFGECIDGFQNRECIDLNGFHPNLIETRVCSVVVLENATLGFESFFSTNDVLKCSPNWNLFIGCTYSIGNITLDRPTGWNVVDPAYGFANFLQMTQEYATEGTRSLKMWQIPPKTGEVVDNDTCGNLTSSVIPQMFQGVSNTTFSVSHNVTFPAENMQISFDVKACNSQVLQHSALVDEGLLFNVTLCNQKCYGNFCDTQPNAKFVFNIVDTNTSTSLFGVAQYGEASDRTLSPIYDISDLGIIPGRAYNIVFASSTENPNDATGNCFYIDNVQYQVSNINLEEFGCTSRCDGTTRIEASRTETGSCLLVIQEDSPLCTDSATAQSIENEEDYCADSETVKTFIPKKGKFETVSCSEGFICSPFPVQVGNPGSCITEEEAALEDSTVPAEDSQSFLNWFNWLFSPLFIFIIITFLLSAIVSTVGEGLARFQIFGSVLITMMIIGTLPGIAIIPIWVAIAIIVIVALMVAKTLGVFAGTNNGG